MSAPEAECPGQVPVASQAGHRLRSTVRGAGAHVTEESLMSRTRFAVPAGAGCVGRR